MKKLRSIIVLSVFFLFMGIVPSYGQVFSGDFCWSFTANGDSGILDLGVTEIGNGHVLTTGLFTTTSPSFAQSIINGNAELLSDGIHATLTRSRFEGAGITHSVMHMFLNATLDGFFEESVTFDDGVNLVTSFRTGSLFSIRCP